MQPSHSKTYIIAEAGVNHNGQEDKARLLVDIAAVAGADAVKFQLFNPDALVTAHAPTAIYQATNLKNNKISQREMLQALTLPHDAYPRLEAYCKERGVDFLCTPFDHGSMQYLISNTSMRYLKLPSGEITNAPLLLEAARSGIPIILSTGMSDLADIKDALAVLHYGVTHPNGKPSAKLVFHPEQLRDLAGRVILLHCISQYPAPVASTNLMAMDILGELGLPVGFSDHSSGIALAIAAVARGASVIEKHFTYDVQAAGPDHAASLDASGLKAMVMGIRDVELALGNRMKSCQPSEENTRMVARKSVVAAENIQPGSIFTLENLACKRPAAGIDPRHIWELLGKTARRTYAADEYIDETELQ